MNAIRIALANLRFPATPDESATLAVQAVRDASQRGAGIICFPECFIPGYRVGKSVPASDPHFLERAWSQVAAAAAEVKTAVVLGTERFVDGALRISALVINPDGSIAGFQDKVQLDPSEEETFSPGTGRRLFRAGPLTFGISICHEGFRYPETVRWAARRGAQLVFHPHFDEGEPGGYRPTSFADAANTFHEKTALCRAAENTCYFATVNCASENSPTTSAVIRPDGTLLSCQPYGEEGLLVADIDIAVATRLLASRYRPDSYQEIDAPVHHCSVKASDTQAALDSEFCDFVIGLEETVWSAVTQRDGKALAELFAADYIEITLEGERVDRNDIVTASPKVDEITGYAIDRPKVIPLDENNAVLNYHLTLDGRCRGELIQPRDRWATSVWTRIDGRWRCRFFQQSRYDAGGGTADG